MKRMTFINISQIPNISLNEKAIEYFQNGVKTYSISAFSGRKKTVEQNTKNKYSTMADCIIESVSPCPFFLFRKTVSKTKNTNDNP